ncbi:MAG: glycoside hydrolase family 25 protein, partial [Coriobacteriia bacterium]|nr:glycoside hydrolase family 25 protein [Coriobacteriia bacterium]
MLTASSSRLPRQALKRLRLPLIIIAIELVVVVCLPIINAAPNGSKSSNQGYPVFGPQEFAQYSAPNIDPSQLGSLTRANPTVTVESSGSPTVLVGIDVSEHQGEIDWQAVRANGIDFAFIRIGARGYISGKIILDAYYHEYIESAVEAGIKVGVYFFSQSLTQAEAIEEAEFVLRTLGDRQLDLPIVYDFETVSDSAGRANHLPTSERSANARAFCEHIEAAGYQAMIYANTYDMMRYESTLMNDYEIWYAEFNVYQPRLAIHR